MKFVLCGSRAHYDRFMERLWEKDKNTSDYRHIHRIDTILGAGSGNELIVLANATEHPDYEYLLKECEARGIHRRSARRDRIGHGRSPSESAMRYYPRSRFQYAGTPHEPMRGTEASLSIIDETRYEDTGLTAEMITDTMERIRDQGFQEPTYFTAPESGHYNISIGGHRVEEEIQSPQATEASNPEAEYVAQEQERLRPEEREEDRSDRWWQSILETDGDEDDN